MEERIAYFSKLHKSKSFWILNFVLDEMIMRQFKPNKTFQDAIAKHLSQAQPFQELWDPVK